MSNGTIKAAKKFDRKIIMVPLILILLRIWGTMRFLFFVVDRQSTLLQREILISMQVCASSFYPVIQDLSMNWNMLMYNVLEKCIM